MQTTPQRQRHLTRSRNSVSRWPARNYGEFFARKCLSGPATFNTTHASNIDVDTYKPQRRSAGDPIDVKSKAAASAPVRYLPPAVNPIEMEWEDDQTRENVVLPRRRFLDMQKNNKS